MNPAGGRCDVLRFTRERFGELFDGDSVLVSRVSPTVWRVRSQPDSVDGTTTIHRDRAYCVSGGRSYRMPFEIYIAQNP